MKKLLTLFAVIGAVVVGGVAYAQTTDTTVDARFGEFFGAAESKVESMVDLVIDLSEDGLSKEEIVAQILANRARVADSEDLDDLTDGFNQFRVRNLVLRRGTDGDDVSLIQRILNSLDIGVGEIEIDGRFGPGTEAAVKAFQRLFGLSDDGVIGPRTRLKIQEKLGEVDIKFRNEDGRFRLRLEQEDDEDDSDELEIEAEIENGVAKVKIEYADGTEEEFTVDSIVRSTIVDAIVTRTDLTGAQINSVIKFKFGGSDDDDDDEEDDNDDDDNSGSGNSDDDDDDNS